MKPPRTVTYYRERDEVAVTVRSGKQKWFSPGRPSVRRLREVLYSLDAEGRIAFGFATIYGGGLHCFIDPRWLRK